MTDISEFTKEALGVGAQITTSGELGIPSSRHPELPVPRCRRDWLLRFCGRKDKTFVNAFKMFSCIYIVLAI